MRRPRLMNLLLVALVAAPSSEALVAQGPGPVLTRSVAQPQAEPHAPRWGSLPDTARKYPDTYWKEGLFIGGGLAGLFGAALAAGLCSISENSNDNCTLATIGGFAVMGGAGGSIGALIGGAFPKAARDSASTR
jgi:hypothetical protein